MDQRYCSSSATPSYSTDSHDCFATQSISFDAYQVQDEEKSTFRLFSFDLITRIPYEPKPLNNAGVLQGAIYPGVSFSSSRSR